MLKRILLYGDLKREFGREFVKDVDTASPAEAIVALKKTVPGFAEYFRKHAKSRFKVMAGFNVRNEQSVYDPCGKSVIRIVPVVSGAKSDDMQFLTGAAITAIGLFVTAYGGTIGTTIMNIGITMMVGGVAQMLSNTPRAAIVPTTGKGPSDTPTYSFSGPHMTLGQGNPIPVLLGGPLRIGGALISLGLCPETYPDKGFGNAAADNIGTRSGNGDTTPWTWAIRPVA